MKSKAIRFGLALVVLMSLTAGFAGADDKVVAVKMVKDAVALYKESGLEKTLDAINDPQGIFFEGELYVFAFDGNGVLLANDS